MYTLYSNGFLIFTNSVRYFHFEENNIDSFSSKEELYNFVCATLAWYGRSFYDKNLYSIKVDEEKNELLVILKNCSFTIKFNKLVLFDDHKVSGITFLSKTINEVELLDIIGGYNLSNYPIIRPNVGEKYSFHNSIIYIDKIGYNIKCIIYKIIPSKEISDWIHSESASLLALDGFLFKKYNKEFNFKFDYRVTREKHILELCHDYDTIAVNNDSYIEIYDKLNDLFEFSWHNPRIYG